MLLYGAKTPKDIIFRDEFPRYRDLFEVFLTVDRADPEEYWRGETGSGHKALRQDSPSTHFALSHLFADPRS